MAELYSLNQLFAERVREHPDLEVLCIPDKDFNFTKYTTSELDTAASVLANHLKDTGALPGRAKGDTTSKLTVGLLGVSNVDYVVTELALFRMGYCVLFLSPNNSPAAIAHLLTATNASYILAQPALLSSAVEALTYLSDPSSVSIVEQPSSDVFAPGNTIVHQKTQWNVPLSPESEAHLPITIIHSSGTTGFPKPIVSTNKATVDRYRVNFNRGALTTFTTLPLHHSYGQSNMLRAWFSVQSLYYFPAAFIPLTSANMIKVLTKVPQIEALHGAPFTFKLLAEVPEGVQLLRRLKVVMFGGSACPDELGDYLVSQGVRLVSFYGLTEMGQLMSSLRDFSNDKEWNWVRAKGAFAPANLHEYLRFVPQGGDTYELYVLDGWKAKVMSNQPDGSYATRDLFIKHPTLPDAYKYIGRVDDTIVMVNGEKTNPVPIELTLRSSPYVADAIVFGSGRTQIGAFVIPTEAGRRFSPEEFIRRIASVIAIANAEAPSHSQLSTEAIVFLPFGTVVPKSDKGGILRPKVYQQFEKVIEGVYSTLEGETGSEGKLRVEDETEARAIVRDVIGKTLEKPIDGLEDDTDLFNFGLDSLQSTRIRNAIQRQVSLGGKKLPINVIFEHPSISKLAELIVSLSSGRDTDALRTDSREVMCQLVDKYSNFTYQPQVRVGDTTGVRSTPSGKVVVLTGATGSLGAYVLNELLADSEVETVYCLCRAKNDADAGDRLAASMSTRKLSRDVKLDERVVALAADLPAVRLGLDEERYREIVNRATVVIHNAWAVNFNLGFSSFETHIRGAVNLMQLALSSPHAEPAKFYFASSISAVLNWPGPGLAPEAVADDPTFAQDMGYAQSKWITEKLCQIAARKTPMHTTVLRIGQMVGDTTNGVWNESEGISLIIKCADTIGILPKLDSQVSWLPVDYAAKSIVELVNLPIPPPDCPVYQILHPTLVRWSTILDSLEAAQVRFKRVSRRDWLKALRASDPDERLNPSRKLLAFYEAAYGGEEEKVRVGLCVNETVSSSRWLREVPPVDEGLVAKWVEAWRERGFLAKV